jgi:DNA-binding MarR family transcriptional regulator
LGLTAARFDLLYQLQSRERDVSVPYATLQSALRRSLGVCSSVVSRMLTSLEALGLVTRRRLPQGDSRQRLVMLTATGRQRIATAFRMLRRASWRLVHPAICFGKHRDESLRLAHTERLDAYLGAMRTHYDDTATIYYPWHPDD